MLIKVNGRYENVFEFENLKDHLEEEVYGALEEFFSYKLSNLEEELKNTKEDVKYFERQADGYYCQSVSAINELTPIIKLVESGERLNKKKLILSLKEVLNTLENY